MKKTLGSLAFVLVLAALGLAHAGISKKVQKAFRGQLLITQGPFMAEGSDDADTIASLKRARVRAVKHTEINGVAEWTFDYTAFLKRPPRVSKLSVDFYTTERKPRYVANKGLMGIDPSLRILSGTLTINEDDGPTRGRTYTVKITGKGKRGREVTFAETKLTLK